MKGLLIYIAVPLVWFLAITEALTSVFCIVKAKRTLNILASIVSVGLSIDAFIIAIGAFIGEGQFLKTISQFRYILHGALVPLLIPIAFYTLEIHGKNKKIALWITTSVVTSCGIVMGIVTITEPVYYAGILRYGQANTTNQFAKIVNLILSFGGVIPLIVIGIIHLIKNKSPFLMISGLVMFIFSAIAPATGNMDLNFITTMIGEDLMVFFFGIELIKANKRKRLWW